MSISPTIQIYLDSLAFVDDTKHDENTDDINALNTRHMHNEIVEYCDSQYIYHLRSTVSSCYCPRVRVL